LNGGTMAKKKEYVIKYKFENSPWIEWARTQVPSIVDHYESGARQENPGALVGTFVDNKLAWENYRT